MPLKEMTLFLQEEENGAHLLNLVVDASWRGQGCGTLLMHAAEAVVDKRWGARRVYVEVGADNTVGFLADPPPRLLTPLDMIGMCRGGLWGG